ALQFSVRSSIHAMDPSDLFDSSICSGNKIRERIIGSTPHYGRAGIIVNVVNRTFGFNFINVPTIKLVHVNIGRGGRRSAAPIIPLVHPIPKHINHSQTPGRSPGPVPAGSPWNAT